MNFTSYLQAENFTVETVRMVEERFTGTAESISADDLELVAEITSKIVQQDIADKEVRKKKSKLG